MTRLIRNISLEGDRIIWGVVFALSMLSILVVYSAAGWTYFFSHITKLIIGLACMYMVHKWKFKYFDTDNS